MSLATVRAGMKAALESFTGIRSSTYVTDDISPPAGGAYALFDFSIDYDLNIGGSKDAYHFTVQLFAQRDSERAAQTFLDTCRDPTSGTGLKDKIESNATLAAACDYAQVTKVGAIQVVSVSGVEYLMLELDVEVVV